MKYFLLLSILLHLIILFVYQLKQTNNDPGKMKMPVQYDRVINLKSFHSVTVTGSKKQKKELGNQIIYKNANLEKDNQISHVSNSDKNEGDSIELLHFVEPSYPVIARQRNLEGKVIIELLIMPDGSVEEINLIKSSGADLLDKSAIESAKSWKFKSRHDQTKVKFTKEIIFQLNN